MDIVNRLFFFSNVILFALALSWMLLAIMFIGIEFFDYKTSYRVIFASIITFVVIFFIIVCLLTAYGIWLSTMDTTYYLVPGGYCILMLALVVIPMFTYATFLNHIAGMSNSDLDTLCLPDNHFENSTDTGHEHKVDWLNDADSSVHYEIMAFA